MSLVAWYPLNGDLTNNACSDFNLVNKGATIDNEGKTGKCYLFNGSNVMYSKATIKNMTYGVTTWVKFSSVPTATQWIFCLNDKASNGDVQLGIFANGSGKSFNIYGHGATDSCSFPYVIEANKWYHMALTGDGEEMKFYFNGELVLTQPIVSSLEKNNFTLGARSESSDGAGTKANYYFKGKLNDFRLYNHCLSESEVKEISKAKILHYDFKTAYGNPNLIKNSNAVTSWVAEGVTKTQELNDLTFYKCLKVETTNTGKRIYRNVENVWLNVGQSYTVSFYAKANVDGLKMDASRSIADFSESFTLTTQWKKYVGKIVITGTSSSGTLSLRFNSIGTYYIADVKLEEGDIATNFCPHISDSDYDVDLRKTVYDISGYKNNGTLKYNSNFENTNFFADSIVGGNSYFGRKKLFDGSATYNIVKGNKPFKELQEITISFWMYRTVALGSDSETFIACSSISSSWAIWIAQNTSTRNGLTTYMWHKDLIVDSGIELNRWYNITITAKKGEFINIYINGEEKAHCDSFTPVEWVGNEILTIGDLRDGRNLNPNVKISDLRIYASVLSDEDVIRLYQDKEKVDNLGSLYCSELTEIRKSLILDEANIKTTADAKIIQVNGHQIEAKVTTGNTWQSIQIDITPYLKDKEIYYWFVRASKDCNRNEADGSYNRYYGSSEIYATKTDGTTTKYGGINKISETEKTYNAAFTVDFTNFTKYRLMIFPNCTDTTSYINGNYIYDYVDVIAKKDMEGINLNSQGIVKTGELFEGIKEFSSDNFNRTKVNEIYEGF